MPEAFVWSEGQIALWTGASAPSTSAVIAYAENIQAMFARGWDEHESIDGVYARHLTGQSVDVSFGAIYTYDSTIARMFDSATAVHMKLQHSSVNGSAGYLIYSGNIASLALAGSLANPYIYTLGYRANAWSAYGG